MCVLVNCQQIFSQISAEADSLFRYLPTLPEAEQVDQINAQFYQLYSADFIKATQLAKQALAITQDRGWQKKEALTLKNLGIVSFLQGQYEAALQYYQRAVNTYESIDDAGGQGNVYNEMGVFFKKRKEWDRALEYLDRAYQLCGKANDAYCQGVSLDNRGGILLDQGKLEQADSIFRIVVTLRKAINDSIGLSYVYNNLSSVAVEKGRLDDALDYLQQSTNIRRRMNDRQGVAININNMGEVLYSANRPQEAIPYFEESLVESRALQFTDLERHTMQMLADANEAVGSYLAALNWLNLSNALKDSLFNEERSAQIAEMQEKYESEKREKELTREQLRVRQRTSLLVLVSIGLLLLGIIFVLVFRQQQQRQIQLLREAKLRENLVRQEVENELQQERLRISRDLHDNLGAELTLISSALAQKAFRTKDEGEKQALVTIGDNARQAMEELRETIWAIRGQGDTIESLALRLQDFSGRFDHADIHIVYDPTIANMALTPSRTLNLYRIGQEAIHNALKHAPDSKIDVAFRQINNQLLLNIIDQGPGFDPHTHSTGYGLHNMQERALEMQGECKLETSELGTTILVSIPVKQR
ncbi:MAG: hypothetical protein DHS20C18_01920 [Saprospiraceae bacterium]|nr:MAG: hypothetical protein DHS20C18_01920 [Saprospiraceae bacterium]